MINTSSRKNSHPLCLSNVLRQTNNRLILFIVPCCHLRFAAMPRQSSTSTARTISLRSTASNDHRPGKLQFPLPDNYFAPVNLSLSQAQAYQAKVEKMVTNAIKSCRAYESQVVGSGVREEKGWEDVARDTNLSIMRRKQDAITFTRTFGTVAGDFRRFIDFFSSGTSDELFAWNQFFFGCAIDAAVLCKLALDKSAKQASLGIKWTCLQPSVLTRKRDECFLEYIVFKKDDQGRDVAVIVRLPVTIPECPPLPNELKTKREKITSVTVVRASDTLPSATQVFQLSQCDNKGLIASTRFCRKFLRALKDVARSADAKRIACAISFPGHQEQSRVEAESLNPGSSVRSWVPSAGNQQGCSSCTRPFRGAHRRRQCQMCGDVFCSKCLVQRASIRQQKNVFTNSVTGSNQRTFRLAQLLFCKVCVNRSREEAMPVSPTPMMTTRCSPASPAPSSLYCSSSIGSSTQPASSTLVPENLDAPRRSATSVEKNRMSWLSETDSDTNWESRSSTLSSISRNYSVAATVRSSLSSEYSLGRNSLQAMQSLSSSHECDTERADDRIDERCSIYEVIDTKDMVPEKQLRHQSESMSMHNDDDFFTNFSNTVRARYMSTPLAPTTLPSNTRASRRTRSTDVTDKQSVSSKSLDQCIAEQNELLQQVLSASGYNVQLKARTTASSVPKRSCEDDYDNHDESTYDL
ncbi:hypothetical protein PsorP6_016110 [Peronosclerospora sorghi]|uniref:Uncharacterized protein n=1 Tax=Peronosclerospora sorghi TaxID=230839 RepID=A0ACC0VN07_9STRA|nr:hypothetical protein PsorP6_016110 [Peronosclerospora sorghi]